jgi:hypothetical protein
MSFVITGNTRVGLKVTGLNEAIRAADEIRREIPQVKMRIHRKGSTFFVLKAKERVHKISGDLGRSIEVESITPERAIIIANMPYARKEEKRKGNRRIPPHTPHAYMKPAAIDTAGRMSVFTKQEFDALLARHKTV